MFDSLDAALYYPSNKHIYFFKGPHYMKWKSYEGMVPVNGRVVREIGVDGWRSFPANFRQGINAALAYSNGFTYFFRGDKYIKYEPGAGVVELDGNKIRRIGIDG